MIQHSRDGGYLGDSDVARARGGEVDVVRAHAGRERHLQLGRLGNAGRRDVRCA